MERNNFRLSYWISRVTLNKYVYYVIWDQLVFSSWKRLPNSIFTKKILKKKILKILYISLSSLMWRFIHRNKHISSHFFQELKNPTKVPPPKQSFIKHSSRTPKKC